MERDIDKFLKRKIEGMEGLYLKFTSPGNDGVPDRIVILPGGEVWFIELKTKEGRVTPVQGWQQDRLRKMGCNVRTVQGEEEAKWFVEECWSAIDG